MQDIPVTYAAVKEIPGGIGVNIGAFFEEKRGKRDELRGFLLLLPSQKQ